MQLFKLKLCFIRQNLKRRKLFDSSSSFLYLITDLSLPTRANTCVSIYHTRFTSSPILTAFTLDNALLKFLLAWGKAQNNDAFCIFDHKITSDSLQRSISLWDTRLVIFLSLPKLRSNSVAHMEIAFSRSIRLDLFIVRVLPLRQ